MNARTPPSMVTLVLLTAMGILSLNMFSPSLAHIAEDFGADYGLVSLSVGGYLAITAVLQLILGPMSDRYGRRPVLLFGLVLFTFASVGCNTYPELFRSRRYWGYSICLAFSVSSFYTFTAGAPLVAQKIFGMPPSILGLWMGTITLGFFITSFIAGKLAKRYALTTMMVAGRILTSVGLTVGLCILLSGFVHPYVFFASTVFVGMGNGLTLPSANVGAMSVRPELAGSASGLTGALSVGTGAVVTTLTGLLLTPENGAWMLVLILLGMALIGLMAGWYVRVLDAREGPV